MKLYILFFIFLYSCTIDLSNYKDLYSSDLSISGINTNGYYYHINKIKKSDNKYENGIKVFIFYKNGLVLSFATTIENNESISEGRRLFLFENYFQNFPDEINRPTKNNCGVFRTYKDSLYIKYRQPFIYSHLSFKGELSSDTTFYLNNNEFYRFKKFDFIPENKAWKDEDFSDL